MGSNEFSIIAAMDENRGIGKNNALPWHLSADLKHFAQITKGGTVIMGRKTWESLPDAYKPLKERLNIVVSHGEIELPETVELAHSLDEALAKAKGKTFVIGGATLYTEAIKHPNCKELYITQIQGYSDCDAIFPPIGENFHLKELSEKMTEQDIRFQFLVYVNEFKENAKRALSQ